MKQPLDRLWIPFGLRKVHKSTPATMLSRDEDHLGTTCCGRRLHDQDHEVTERGYDEVRRIYTGYSFCQRCFPEVWATFFECPCGCGQDMRKVDAAHRLAANEEALDLISKIGQ